MIKLYALKFIITQIDCDIDRRIDRSKRTMSQHQQNEENKRQLADLMIAQNFAILDIEYIQTRKNHKCIRKIHILAKNGSTKLTKEFYPCWKFNDLESKYRRSFLYCRRNIHRLPYNPPKRLQPLDCQHTGELLKSFIALHKLNFILYKGGNVEKELCNTINIPAYNIEIFDIDKASNHNPEEEVSFYFREMTIRVPFLQFM